MRIQDPGLQRPNLNRVLPVSLQMLMEPLVGVPVMAVASIEKPSFDGSALLFISLDLSNFQLPLITSFIVGHSDTDWMDIPSFRQCSNYSPSLFGLAFI